MKTATYSFTLLHNLNAKLLACLLCFFIVLNVQAQKAPFLPYYDVRGLITVADSFRNAAPTEKAYLQLDKPYYTMGDTLWFKSYVFNADFLTPSKRSGLLYVELDDAAGNPAKRIMVRVVQGVSWGNIALNKDNDIAEGNYTLRAYTNWMRNFGNDYVFKKNIYITALSAPTLVQAAFKLDSTNNKNNIAAKINLVTINNDPIRLKDMQLRVTNGRRTLFRDKITTGMDGSMALNFDLADKTTINKLAIKMQQTGKTADTATLIVPITINRPENTDIQFMPEGGNMVAGIASKIGFKAISEDGRGLQVSGKIFNSKQQQVASFTSAHKGMGAFTFIPQAGEVYSAKVTFPAGVNKTYLLPVVKASGTTLSVQAVNDSLQVTLAVTADMLNHTQPYYFVVQGRGGIICYAAGINFKQQVLKKSIPKNLLPTGIAHFTLLNNVAQPVNERIVFVNHNDKLQLTVTPDKPNYGKRDSVLLNLRVTDKNGSPVQGLFSVAVTDNGQVKTDSTGNNITNNILLTADLKGTVEEPAYYLHDTTPLIASHLDNLMLTQGWVGYDWKPITSKKMPAQLFPAEPDFLVQGKVVNIFNKPVAGANVLLYSKNPALIIDTLTDKDGIFTFRDIFPIDTAIFKLQARNKRGKSFNVGITANEFKPPVFTAGAQVLPWYVNTDTLLLNKNITKAAQLKATYADEGTLLKEVTINSKKSVKNSKNLNGAGEADIIMDEKEMGTLTHLSLYDLLLKKFKNNFHRETVLQGMEYHVEYYLFNHRVNLFIDGLQISKVMLEPDLYMNSMFAEDVKGIEIMRTVKYAMAYDPNFIRAQFGKERNIPIFLEITTYSGNGAFSRNTIGTYLYKTVPFSVPKIFYSPKYTVKNSSLHIGTDLRSTIHWKPNIVTDAEGKASIRFFTTDRLSTYTVTTEGSDMDGHLGHSEVKMKANKQPTDIP